LATRVHHSRLAAPPYDPIARMELPGASLGVRRLPLRREPSRHRCVDVLSSPESAETYADSSSGTVESSDGGQTHVLVLVRFPALDGRARRGGFSSFSSSGTVCGLLAPDLLRAEASEVLVSDAFVRAHGFPEEGDREGAWAVGFRIIPIAEAELSHVVFDVFCDTDAPNDENVSTGDVESVLNALVDTPAGKDVLRRCVLTRPVFVGGDVFVSLPGGGPDTLERHDTDGNSVDSRNARHRVRARVSDCRPSMNGVVTANTVIVLRIGARAASEHSSEEAPISDDPESILDGTVTPPSTPPSEVIEGLELANSLIFSPGSGAVAASPRAADIAQKTCAVSLQALPVSSPVFDAFDASDLEPLDLNDVILVHWTTLRSLGVFHGSIASVAVFAEADPSPSPLVRPARRRWVRLYESDSVAAGQAIAPALGFFRLAGDAFWDLRSSANNGGLAEIRVELECSVGSSPQVSTTCVLSRVRRPGSSPLRDVSAEIRRHFALNRPGVLHVGDIIAVFGEGPESDVDALCLDALGRSLRFPTHVETDRTRLLYEGEIQAEQRTRSTLRECAADLRCELFQVGSLGIDDPAEIPGAMVVPGETEMTLSPESAGVRLVPHTFETSGHLESDPLPAWCDQITATLSAALRQTRERFVQFDALICGPAGSGTKSALAKGCDQLGIHYLGINGYLLLSGVADDDVAEFVAHSNPNQHEPSEGSSRRRRSIGDTQVATLLWRCAEAALSSAPCVLHIEHINALSEAANGADSRPNQRYSVLAETLKEIAEYFSERRDVGFVFLCVSANLKLDEVPATLRSHFTNEYDLWQHQEAAISSAERFIDASRMRVADNLMPALEGSFQRGSYSPLTVRQILCAAADRSFTDPRPSETSLPATLPFLRPEDVSEAAREEDRTQKLTQPSGAASVTVPTTRWSDVGGLEHVKEAVVETIEYPLRFPQLFSSGGKRRSGLLFWGPPGTGKTLVAKAVATECGLNFLSVKGPELLDSYVGESERNVRMVFENAREHSPCVIFFDELDSLAPSRGRGADSGGVMDRVVSQLLSEMDGMHSGSTGSADDSVFIIGATNRPDLIDAGLLRPGRFDKLLYLGPCESVEAKCSVMTAQTRKMPLLTTDDASPADFPSDDVVDFPRVCELLPRAVTPADLHALCSDAMLAALTEKILVLEERRKRGGEEKSEEGTKLRVLQRHFAEAASRLTPSVSEQEMARYEATRHQYESGAVEQELH
jgi:SpoVK/Ycf46/Vps4 family AAA+-type ATPase